MSIRADIKEFIDGQLAAWPMAADNFAALADVDTKAIKIGNMEVRVQFNPARAVSSGAKVDAATIARRKCFLCAENRPVEQSGLDWEGRYTILLNPFPIFPGHLTIADYSHKPQAIALRLGDMIGLAKDLDGYIVFYNGPRCGASAPDHAHFQAIPVDSIPLPAIVENAGLKTVLEDEGTVLSAVTGTPLKLFVIDSDSESKARKVFQKLYKALPRPSEEEEPMMNILAYATPAGVRLLVIPRKKHRPSFYGTEGEDTMMLSPAAVDLGGVFITPRKCDFDRISSEEISKVYDELCLNDEDIETISDTIMHDQTQPTLSVGLMTGVKFIFNFTGTYIVDGIKVTGRNTVERSDNGDIVWNSDHYTDIVFEATADDCTFELEGIVIGIGFHWERKETQRFKGSLKFVGGPVLTAINIIKIEDYLESVISSEMSATAPVEFLKAHSVISRSWILAQIRKHEIICDSKQSYESINLGQDEILRWYDREDHTLFHVCADDHCQRYQGINRQSTPAITEAVQATRGIVLVDENDDLCDARFSKCCGGVFEEFENCWEPVHHSYLESRRDAADEDNYPDLTIEENARKWIMSSPESYCNTKDINILSKVLNKYDQETTDFYRWSVRYTQEELSEIIHRRSGIDFGRIKYLEAVERGTSGRIVRLRIVGEYRTIIIGKELEIRRTLSNSHLYSSAFVVETAGTSEEGYPATFVLHGAGWGHGVGLCQIGAAVMGSNGTDYREILRHYFHDAKLKTLYR